MEANYDGVSIVVSGVIQILYGILPHENRSAGSAKF